MLPSFAIQSPISKGHWYQALVEKVMTSFMAEQRVELKPADDESPNTISSR
jgi:hypothetical protein